MLNEKQKRAVKSLIRALNNADAAGLVGGVYDSSFCVWPVGAIDLDSAGNNFFRLVSEHGHCIGCDEVSMRLDGGSGT